MNVVLITGASVGLGLAIARQLVDDDTVHLVLTARGTSLCRFEEAGLVEGPRLWIRELDITHESERRAVVEEIEAAYGHVSTLINNAGITYRTVTEYATPAELGHQMAVNYEGPMALCALVLPSMRQHRTGRIIQISSASGLAAMPTMGLYSASKFALEGASEAMHFEVRPFGIQVSLVIAGFINSLAYQKSIVGPLSKIATRDVADCYHSHFTYMDAAIHRMMKLTTATSESVAAVVVRTMRKRRAPLRVLATWDAVLLWWFRRYTPQFLFVWLTYHLLPGVNQWRGGLEDTSAASGEFERATARQAHANRRRRRFGRVGSFLARSRPENRHERRAFPRDPGITMPTESPNAQTGYAAAYLAHYTDKNMLEALRLYSAVLEEHPDTRESRDARIQIHNITAQLVSIPEMVQSDLSLAVASITTEVPQWFTDFVERHPS